MTLTTFAAACRPHQSHDVATPSSWDSDLTRRQREILVWISECCAAGRPPTTREMMTRFAMRSPNSVVGHLRALWCKGWIRWDRWQARGIAMGPRLYADGGAGWSSEVVTRDGDGDGVSVVRVRRGVYAVCEVPAAVARDVERALLEVG